MALRSGYMGSNDRVGNPTTLIFPSHQPPIGAAVCAPGAEFEGTLSLGPKSTLLACSAHRIGPHRRPSE
jgi:hypothetical protein